MEYLLSFLVGLVVGSFLNVCIHRIPRGESVASPPSHCPYCGKELSWYDNIPVLSYILLRGRCRYCGRAIPFRYPLVEVLSALLTLAVVVRFGVSVSSIYYAVLLWVLILISFIDIATFSVPVKLCYFTMLGGLAFSFLVPEVSVVDSVLGASLGAGIVLFIIETYAVITGKEGMGYGDANIMAVVGAFVGWRKVLLVMFFASVTGAVVGVVYGLLKGKGLKVEFPCGPFISVGTAVAVLAGDRLLSAYLSLVGGGW